MSGLSKTDKTDNRLSMSKVTVVPVVAVIVLALLLGVLLLLHTRAQEEIARLRTELFKCELNNRALSQQLKYCRNVTERLRELEAKYDSLRADYSILRARLWRCLALLKSCQNSTPQVVYKTRTMIIPLSKLFRIEKRNCSVGGGRLTVNIVLFFNMTGKGYLFNVKIFLRKPVNMVYEDLVKMEPEFYVNGEKWDWDITVLWSPAGDYMMHGFMFEGPGAVPSTRIERGVYNITALFKDVRSLLARRVNELQTLTLFTGLGRWWACPGRHLH